MKKFLIIPLAIFMAACSGNNNETNTETAEVAAPEMVMASFGATINEDDAQSVDEVIAAMSDKDSMAVKLTGTVDKVCQVKGCWMTMPYGDGESMRISFRDYGFFVPKDIDGKEVIIEGTVYLETTSVEDLRHFAEDEGLSQEEIEKITEPETAYTFVADGVIVKDYTAAEVTQPTEGHDHDHDHGDGHDHDHEG